jgi:hypothetical protein
MATGCKTLVHAGGSRHASAEACDQAGRQEASPAFDPQAHGQTCMRRAAAHPQRRLKCFNSALMQLTRMVRACSPQYPVPNVLCKLGQCTMMRWLRRYMQRLRVYFTPQCGQGFRIGHAMRSCSACTHCSQRATWVQGSPADKGTVIPVQVLRFAERLLFSLLCNLRAA